MSKPKVILDPHFRFLDEIFEPADLARLHTVAEVIWGRDEPMPQDAFDAAKGDAFAVVTTRWRYGSLDGMPHLRAILEVGGRHPSPQQLDYAACFSRGIRVLSCAPAFGPMVAEMALGVTLALARGIVAGDNAFRRGDEVYLRPGNADAFSLYGETFGFIGYGGLARALKPLLAPFGGTIMVHDPWLPESHLARQGVTPASLEEVLSRARVIYVLAIPSLDNRALLDRRRLELIRPGAVLVLISRAHLVDFDALVDLLRAGRFKAAIDVFPQEPVPPDHPIRTTPNTVLSAHLAGSVWTEMRRIGRMVVDDIAAMAHGLPPTEMQIAQPEFISRLE